MSLSMSVKLTPSASGPGKVGSPPPPNRLTTKMPAPAVARTARPTAARVTLDRLFRWLVLGAWRCPSGHGSPAPIPASARLELGGGGGGGGGVVRCSGG